MFAIYKDIKAARAVLTPTDVLINATRKKTSNCPTGLDVSIVIPFANIRPTVDDSIRDLVHGTLLDLAERQLAEFCLGTPMASEVSPDLFTVESLTEFWQANRAGSYTQDDLLAEFKLSATWARIASRPDYTTSKAYQQKAEYFLGLIKQVAGKGIIPAAKRDIIIAKMEASDLDTAMGAYIARRLDQMAKREAAESNETDVDAL